MAFKNEYCLIYLENDILFLRYTKRVNIDFVMAKEIVKQRLKIANGESWPMLVDIKNVTGSTVLAREHFAGNDGTKLITKGAFLVNNWWTCLLGNISNMFKPSKISIKLFVNESRALKWIKK